MTSPETNQNEHTKVSSDRAKWRSAREAMERGGLKHTPVSSKTKKHWIDTLRALHIFGYLLKFFGFYARGVRNAANYGVTEFEIEFDNLPGQFDGYRILHITDPHLDQITGWLDGICERITKLEVDLCAVTGDFQDELSLPPAQIVPLIKKLRQAIHAPDGAVATLGNHDKSLTVDALESLGFNCLINESLIIRRDEDAIQITGLDDVHYYYTGSAREALAQNHAAFRVALVHSPEIADIAADNGYSLYLAGHTHGGQICLPGGRPILTHLTRFREYAAGLWRHQGMTGYTSSGLGVSGIPVRFNSRGEVAVITLRKS